MMIILVVKVVAWLLIGLWLFGSSDDDC